MIGTLIEANDRIIAALEMYDTVRTSRWVLCLLALNPRIAFKANCDREGRAERAGGPCRSQDQRLGAR